ncbi:MAG: RNA-binding transcriptional accessory protein [Bacteroidales bacterium]|nr:RNA-binding transcriptional accessory protein [Bacteroidales bacterium]
MNERIIKHIAAELAVELWQVKNTLELHDGGATIPFIARYRKEVTGSLTDEQIIKLLALHQQQTELEKRRESILKSLEEQDIHDEGLIQKINEAENMSRLEDLYLPYRPKRKTRGSMAMEKGLEPLAKMIMSEKINNLTSTVLGFIDSKNGINDEKEALQGARDIMAEWFNETDWIRSSIRRLFQYEAQITSTITKGKEEEGAKYQSYFDWSEPAKKASSHRILAMFRGENEGFLKVKVVPSEDKAFQQLSNKIIRSYGEAAKQKEMALKDSIGRLLFPSLETEYRKEIREKAELSAVKVFSDNLRQLLLAPPMGMVNVLAIDPGFRTGCKVVCLDKNGNLLHNETIYPHPPQNKTADAVKKIKSLVNAYNIDAIAIGNGTAGRETENLIQRTRFDKDVTAVVVNEDGASVYSASEIARKEFPEYDVTVRGSVSIGRRLQDPLSEMVKIDPKSLGVGQYQHDINPKLLKENLQTTVELCVNAVGITLNSASEALLTYVSGVGPTLAKNIIEYRNENGDFKNRNELKKVKGLGAKAFEQAAGFLRIKDGNEPLDSSAVHPENYKIVKQMAVKAKLTVGALIGNPKVKELIHAEDFVSEEVGLPTLKDILDELEKPGRDPRKKFNLFQFDPNIRTMDDLSVGMTLPGVVTNITDFGAFVDMGIHTGGLIHKSQIADEFVSHPSDYLSINQQVQVKVIELDKERKRISLQLVR